MSFTPTTSSPGRLAAALLDALPGPTAVLDRSGTIVAVNRPWQQFALGQRWATGAARGRS